MGQDKQGVDPEDEYVPGEQVDELDTATDEEAVAEDDTEDVTVGENDGATVDVALDDEDPVAEDETVAVALEEVELEGVGELQIVLLVLVHVVVVAIPLHELQTVQGMQED